MYPSKRALRFSIKSERDKLIEEYAERFGGQENAKIFLLLWYEVVQLLEFWNCERHLFSTENIPVLKRTDGKFWALHQDVLQDRILMCLSRLTDDVASRNHKHLSVYQVERLLNCAGIKKGKNLRDLLKRIRKDCRPIREYRDKVLAHSDLEFHLNPEYKYGLTRGQVDDLVDLLKDAILLTEKAFGLDDDSGWANHTFNRAEHFMQSLQLLLEKNDDEQE